MTGLAPPKRLPALILTVLFHALLIAAFMRPPGTAQLPTTPSSFWVAVVPPLAAPPTMRSNDLMPLESIRNGVPIQLNIVITPEIRSTMWPLQSRPGPATPRLSDVTTLALQHTSERPPAHVVAEAAIPRQSNPSPNYPELARRNGIEGTVTLKVSIATNGQPISVTVATSSGHDILDAEAVRTVKRWRFRPAPLPRFIVVPIIFELHP